MATGEQTIKIPKYERIEDPKVEESILASGVTLVDGHTYIYVRRVMYGYRIGACDADNVLTIHGDICVGRDMWCANMTYRVMVLAALSRGRNGMKFPRQHRRPLINDITYLFHFMTVNDVSDDISDVTSSYVKFLMEPEVYQKATNYSSSSWLEKK